MLRYDRGYKVCEIKDDPYAGDWTNKKKVEVSWTRLSLERQMRLCLSL